MWTLATAGRHRPLMFGSGQVTLEEVPAVGTVLPVELKRWPVGWSGAFKVFAITLSGDVLDAGDTFKLRGGGLDAMSVMSVFETSLCDDVMGTGDTSATRRGGADAISVFSTSLCEDVSGSG